MDRKVFAQRITEFSKAASALYAAWEHAANNENGFDADGMIDTNLYAQTFRESFDETVLQLSELARIARDRA